MRKRRLGVHGPELSVIALGGHEYLPDGRSRGFNEDRRLATLPGHIGPGYGGAARLEMMGAAYELGINVFDATMDSEKEALGRNMREMPPPHEVYVLSRPEGMCYGYDANNRKLLDYSLLRTEVERMLKLLRRDAIDLLNIGLLNGSIENDPGYMQHLAHNVTRLKGDGLIRYAVADSHSGGALYLKMLETGVFDAMNIDLNFGDVCGLRAVVPKARSNGLHVIAREVMLKGALFTIGASVGLTDKSLLARVAVKWVVEQSPDCVIIGAGDAAQLRNNVAAALSGPMDENEKYILKMLTDSPLFKMHARAKDRSFLATGEAVE